MSTKFDNIELRGKVDRIIFNNNFATIIDYKTGLIPTKNKVLNEESPQLLIYALLLSEGLLKNQTTAAFGTYQITAQDLKGPNAKSIPRNYALQAKMPGLY